MKTPAPRHSPLELRNGKRLKHRIVIPPMASATADTAGLATQKTFEHYARLAKASPSLLMVEYTFVHRTGRSEEFQMGIDSDEHIAGLSRIREIIEASGALAGIQLTHSGGKSERIYTGGYLMAPSPIAVPVKGQELEVPEAMTLNDIALWKQSFLAGVDRAVKAGFQLVEFHAAHGYGLNQFLSPITNKRQDDYGGSLQNNARLLYEIIQCTRALYPDLLLAVRMPGQDFIEGGLTHADTILLAQELERLGVDIIDVSSGVGGWRRPGTRVGEGYLVSEAANIQAKVSIPVIGVGGIETAAYIDGIIAERKVSLAAVGRAILKDPLLWGQTNIKEFLHG